MHYLTDGVHLYEVENRVRNFGLGGGEILLVRDCVTDEPRELGLMEQQLCTPVGTQEPAHA